MAIWHRNKINVGIRKGKLAEFALRETHFGIIGKKAVKLHLTVRCRVTLDSASRSTRSNVKLNLTHILQSFGQFSLNSCCLRAAFEL
jgi:hypothetical protein